MTMTGHKTRSVFERYNIVSAGDLVEVARKLDAARHGHNFGHNGPQHASNGTDGSAQTVGRIGAGDGDRTRDIRLGKPAFYR
jgi:hypothetical protein